MNKKILITIIGLMVAVIFAVVAILLMTSNNKKYTITFNSDGGTLVEEQIVKKGDKVVKPIEPTKLGYQFISWTYQNETYDFSLEVISDMELKAKWYEIKEEIKEYIIKFNTDGGTTFENQIVEEGKRVIKPDNPTKEGYEFKGWFIDDKEYDFEDDVTKDIELKAKWEENNVSENNNSNNNNSNSSNNNDNNTSNIDKEETTKIKTPVLRNVGGAVGEDEYVGFEDGKYIYDLTINFSDYCGENIRTCKIAGWEIYEKDGSNYNKISTGTIGGVATVKIEAGTKKTLVARVYQYNSSNKKVYSEYSNEVVLGNIN